MTRYETQTWKELVNIQNTYFAATQDILTITAFMNDQELEQHLNKYKEIIKQH